MRAVANEREMPQILFRMENITRIASRNNEKLKFVRQVRDRRERDHLFIEGRRLALEALTSELNHHSIFFEEGIRGRKEIHELEEKAWRLEIPAFELPEKIFSTIADTDSPQGIVLISYSPENRPEAIERNLTSSGIMTVVVALTEISNPSNLGAVIRTAEAAGAAGVIVTRDSADAFSPKALRAAMGSAFRLPIWVGEDFDGTLLWARSRGLVLTAADTDANTCYRSIDWKIARLLVFGSEAHGLGADKVRRINELIHIPMKKPVESLNLAVSTGIILFEAKRQFEL